MYRQRLSQKVPPPPGRFRRSGRSNNFPLHPPPPTRPGKFGRSVKFRISGVAGSWILMGQGIALEDGIGRSLVLEVAIDGN